jgi:hypothetical protein
MVNVPFEMHLALHVHVKTLIMAYIPIKMYLALAMVYIFIKMSLAPHVGPLKP